VERKRNRKEVIVFTNMCEDFNQFVIREGKLGKNKSPFHKGILFPQIL
jgi:hypothetical protein